MGKTNLIIANSVVVHGTTTLRTMGGQTRAFVNDMLDQLAILAGLIGGVDLADVQERDEVDEHTGDLRLDLTQHLVHGVGPTSWSGALTILTRDTQIVGTFLNQI